MQLVPVTNDPDQIFTTTLEGQVVRVHLRWLDEGQSWFISVLKTDNTIIFSNTRLNSSTLIINLKLVDFNGDFVAVPTDTESLTPGRNAWGETHQLYFLTKDEATEVLDAIISANI